MMTLARGPSSPRFDDEDIEVVFEIANRVGVAMETAMLYEGQEEAARRAEEDARRSAVLQAMTAAMGRTETSQDVIEATLSEGILAAGAKAGAIGLVDWESREVRIAGSQGFVADDRQF